MDPLDFQKRGWGWQSDQMGGKERKKERKERKERKKEAAHNRLVRVPKFLRITVESMDGLLKLLRVDGGAL